MDITQTLRDAENSLRDFIALTLFQSLGPDWVKTCGVSPERLEQWQARKIVEEKRQSTGVVDERLIYYADFFDLKVILKKHWNPIFSEVFGEWKRFEVYMTELERLRDPDAHRRELLPHQKSLIIGIAGEIRNQIVRYRSRKETAEDYFPRIESARDSLGNIWVPKQGEAVHAVYTGMTLRPGTRLDYIISATDPEDEPLSFSLSIPGTYAKREWQSSNELSLTIVDAHISKNFMVAVAILSPRPFHADSLYDDIVYFFMVSCQINS